MAPRELPAEELLEPAVLGLVERLELGARRVEVAAQADALEQDEHEHDDRRQAENHEDRTDGGAHGGSSSKWRAERSAAACADIGVRR